MISFIVQLANDHHRRLRSGLKVDVYVMNAVKEGVLRIDNASYYVGKGEYELFVRDGKMNWSSGRCSWEIPILNTWKYFPDFSRATEW